MNIEQLRNQKNVVMSKCVENIQKEIESMEEALSVIQDNLDTALATGYVSSATLSADRGLEINNLKVEEVLLSKEDKENITKIVELVRGIKIKDPNSNESLVANKDGLFKVEKNGDITFVGNIMQEPQEFQIQGRISCENGHILISPNGHVEIKGKLKGSIESL